MRALLTDMAVRSLKPPDKGQLTVWDKALRGFGIRLSFGGSKSWVIMVGRERRLITLARYPLLSLKEARDKAKRALLDPFDPVSSITVDEAITSFLKATELKARPRTLFDYRTRLNRHLQSVSQKSISSLSTDRLMEIVDALAPTPSEQLHFFNVAKTFLRFCVQRKYLTKSPLDTIKAPSRHATRERVLSAHELKQVILAASTEPYPFGAIVLLCAYLGQRRGEIGQLRWEYIDQEQRLITLPSAIAKNKIEHCFPYGELTATILTQLPYKTGYLFPGRTDNPTFQGWSRAKENFDKRCPLPQWQLHDLRRGLSTSWAALGIPQVVTEKYINHVSGGVQSQISRVYNRHLYLKEMRDAVQKWEDTLQSLVTG